MVCLLISAGFTAAESVFCYDITPASLVRCFSAAPILAFQHPKVGAVMLLVDIVERFSVQFHFARLFDAMEYPGDRLRQRADDLRDMDRRSRFFAIDIFSLLLLIITDFDAIVNSILQNSYIIFSQIS